MLTNRNKERPMNLTAAQIDALQEMINMGVGQAAGVLNAMLQSHVTLQVPVVNVMSSREVDAKKQMLRKEMLSAVRIGFKGPFEGNASLVFPTESAVKLVILLTEEEESSSELDSIMIGTLTEVGNIVLNGVMGAIGNELKERIFYSVPNYVDDPIQILGSVDALSADDIVVWVQTRFYIEKHHIDGDVVLIFETGSLSLLLSAIDRQLGG
jgi:chemotaxis protein CheC